VAGIADQFMEEILQHNPHFVVAVSDQGSNMGSLTRNMRNDLVEVILDREAYLERMQGRQVVLALPGQKVHSSPVLPEANPPLSLSQLVISGSYKITTSVLADGKYLQHLHPCYPGRHGDQADSASWSGKGPTANNPQQRLHYRASVGVACLDSS
jgi:hypothetical protein